MAIARFAPQGLEIEIDETSTLREAAHLLGIDVHDQCGGIGACCGCIITILQGSEHICPKTHLEEPVFYLGPQDRLSCQCRIRGDVVVQVG